ncbi:MAG: molybdopterin-dependent oxidoreductase [Magnetococcales bacterium]|nr:molybdopterin-dependent oxidoreductase [Magnetococcales bacterium]
MASNDTRRHHTACPLDCPNTCALQVTTEGGKLKEVAGDAEHPYTRGIICGKVSRYEEIQNGPRLTSPLLRRGEKGGGEFFNIGWDEALDIAAASLRERMQTFGSETVWPFYYGGTMGMVQRGAVERLTHRAGFSRIARTVCAEVAEAGWMAGMGRMVGSDPQDIAKSDLVILWGIDAAATQLPLMGFVKEARRRGAKLVVVDPVLNRSARMADWHLALRPGSDGALATAMLHVLWRENLLDRYYLEKWSDWGPDLESHLESRDPQWAEAITGIPAEEIRRFARLYGEVKAPFIRLGMGFSRQANGAVNVHAVSALPVARNAWKELGGGALLMTGGAFHVNDAAVKQPGFMKESTRILDMSRLGVWLTSPTLEPPVTAMMIFNANPVATLPDSGLVREGFSRRDLFTIVHEQVMTDTARFADLVLPATTFLEHDDLYKSYGQYSMQSGWACLSPTGLARSNHQVVNALARRLGYHDAAFREDERTVVARLLRDSGYLPVAQWPKGHWLDCRPPREVRQFQGGYGHRDGRFRFAPAWRNREMPRFPDHWPVNRRDNLEEAARYPLDFMTPPAMEVLNTTFLASEAACKRLGKPLLWLHPRDAGPRGIVSGDWVKVENPLGALTMKARVTEEVRPGLVVCYSNRKSEDFPENRPLNLLSHGDRVAPFGGVAFHDNRVEVIRVESQEEGEEP